MDDLVEKAIMLATEAHVGQKSFRGRPYILHPLRVMEKMDTDVAMAVAVLHDTVEDTKITLEELRTMGFPLEVVEAVDAMSHREGESYWDYIERVKSSSVATRVKIADLEDNMRVERIVHFTKKDEKRLRKYRDAYNELLQHGWNTGAVVPPYGDKPEEPAVPPEEWNACKDSD